MAKKLTDQLADKRTAQRSIHKGLVKREDYEEYLRNLPDVSAVAVFFSGDADSTDAADEMDDEGVDENMGADDGDDEDDDDDEAEDAPVA